MNIDKYYESYIKCDFLNYLRLNKIINVRSRIASEYVLGTTGRRADLAVHNGLNFLGVEVKSQHDNLSRLREQLKVYTACFDDVMIVLDERHVDQGLEIASPDVTVFEIGRKREIRLRRGASIKPRVIPRSRLQLLSTPELKKLIGHTLTPASKRSLLLELASDLPADVIDAAVAGAFRRTFLDTSGNFWRHVKRKRVTLDALNCLSRFGPERINLREKQDEKARFWETWRQDAVIALRQTA